MSIYQAVDGGEEKRENEMKTADVLSHEEKCCRICLEDDSPHTMIAPCKCKGGSKWVHRECLDLWRTNERDRAFSQCTECLFQYHMMPPQLESPTKWRRAKFYVLVSRDVCFMTLLLQLVVAALGCLVFFCDADKILVAIFCGSGTCQNGTRQEFGVYYVCGFLLLLVLLGLYGSIVLCINKCSIKSSIPAFIDPEQGGMMNRGPPPATPHQSGMYRNHRRRSSHRRDADCCDCCVYSYHPIYVYNGDDDCCFCCCSHPRGHSHNNDNNDCGDCGHGRCDESCNDEGSHILLIILVAVAIIMAIIGFVVGIIIAVLLCQRVIQTHIYLLQKRQLVKEFTVMDLSAYDLDEPLVVDSGLTPSSTVYHPPPSAPPMHQEDEIYLQKLGLMS